MKMIRSKKELVAATLEFHERKAKPIEKNHPGIKYLLEDDKQDIRNASYRDLIKFRKRLFSLEYSIIDMARFDAFICFWCSKNKCKCRICEYAQRHGFCNNKDSDYRIITNTEKDDDELGFQSIGEQIGEEKIKSWIHELFTKDSY